MLLLFVSLCWASSTNFNVASRKLCFPPMNLSFVGEENPDSSCPPGTCFSSEKECTASLEDCRYGFSGSNRMSFSHDCVDRIRSRAVGSGVVNCYCVNASMGYLCDCIFGYAMFHERSDTGPDDSRWEASVLNVCTSVHLNSSLHFKLTENCTLIDIYTSTNDRLVIPIWGIVLPYIWNMRIAHVSIHSSKRCVFGDYFLLLESPQTHLFRKEMLLRSW